MKNVLLCYTDDMKLSGRNVQRQREILRRLKSGIPLAGLLAGMAVTTGCDRLKPVGTEPCTDGKEPAPIKLAGDEPAPARCPVSAPTNGVDKPVPPPPPLAGLPVAPDRSPKDK